MVDPWGGATSPAGHAYYSPGPFGAFFRNDHTHFEAAGARQVAGVVATALRGQQIPLASNLK